MRQIEVQVGGDGAGDFGWRRNKRINLKEREILDGDVEVGEILCKVVRNGQTPIAFEELQFLGFDARFVVVDEAGELDGDVAEFAAADDHVVHEQIAGEIDIARKERAVGADSAIEHAAYRTRGIVGMREGNAPEGKIEIEGFGNVVNVGAGGRRLEFSHSIIKLRDIDALLIAGDVEGDEDGFAEAGEVELAGVEPEPPVFVAEIQ